MIGVMTDPDLDPTTLAACATYLRERGCGEFADAMIAALSPKPPTVRAVAEELLALNWPYIVTVVRGAELPDGFRADKLADNLGRLVAALSGALDAPSARDGEWVAAMVDALGPASGFSVPLVPAAEPFRELFAAVRERLAASPDSDGMGELREAWATLVREARGSEDGIQRWAATQSNSVGRLVCAVRALVDRSAARGR